MFKNLFLNRILLTVVSFSAGFLIALNFLVLYAFTEWHLTSPVTVVSNDSKEYFLIILILSAPVNFDKRLTIRNTWLRPVNPTVTKWFFAIGQYTNNNNTLITSNRLVTEQEQFHDLLFVNVSRGDSYAYLTEKLLSSFKQINGKYRFKYLLKCDDDTFVVYNNLYRQLEYFDRNLERITDSDVITVNRQWNTNHDTTKLQLYWGYFNGNARVMRTAKMGKWSEHEWIACDRYVPYALGGAYVLSSDLISYIANNWQLLKWFRAEDVSVGLWLTPLTNLIRIHDIRFDTEWISRGCQNHVFATHNISSRDMVKMYQLYIETKRLCVKETMKRAFYLYKWNLPPSQCCKS